MLLALAPIMTTAQTPDLARIYEETMKNFESGDFQAAVSKLITADSLYVKESGGIPMDSDYINSVLLLITFLSERPGDYATATRFGQKWVDVARQVYGERHPDYAVSLNNLAVYQFRLSNYATLVAGHARYSARLTGSEYAYNSKWRDPGGLSGIRGYGP